MKKWDVVIFLIIILLLGYIWWQHKVNNIAPVINPTQPSKSIDSHQVGKKDSAVNLQNTNNIPPKASSNLIGSNPDNISKNIENDRNHIISRTVLSQPPISAVEVPKDVLPKTSKSINTVSSSAISTFAMVKCCQVASGARDTLALRVDGTLWAWGQNKYGELGLGDTVSRTSPTQVGTDSNWKLIAFGFIDSFGIKTDGTLWAWGSNQDGRLGLGDITMYMRILLPTQVGTDNDWDYMSAGSSHTLAIKTDGTLWAWGDLSIDSILQTKPVKVGNDKNWKYAKCGHGYTLAIKNDGTLWAWGQNKYGELGLGDTVSRTSPTQVGTDNDWANIACKNQRSFAIKTNGTLWAWGFNPDGYLGVGDWIAHYSPVQVGMDNNWYQISYQDTHCLALKTDGTLWTWGYNYHGELGLGDYGEQTFRVTPNKVGYQNDWANIESGYANSYAIKNNGTLWGWGDNYYDDMGLGDTGNHYLFTKPIQIKPYDWKNYGK
ncbi:MAG: hypothetical protein V1701_11550 [Planctomycetota bacterium]